MTASIYYYYFLGCSTPVLADSGILIKLIHYHIVFVFMNLSITAFSLEIAMQGSLTDIAVSRASVHPWRIFTRQGYRKLMVKWLLFLAFLMVCLTFQSYLHSRTVFIS